MPSGSGSSGVRGSTSCISGYSPHSGGFPANADYGRFVSGSDIVHTWSQSSGTTISGSFNR